MQRYDHTLISPNSFHSEQSTSKRASVAASDYFTRFEYRNDAAASSARYRDRCVSRNPLQARVSFFLFLLQEALAGA
jgi:hypothetical protein